MKNNHNDSVESKSARMILKSNAVDFFHPNLIQTNRLQF